MEGEGGGIVQPTNDHPSSVFQAVLIFPLKRVFSFRCCCYYCYYFDRRERAVFEEYRRKLIIHVG